MAEPWPPVRAVFSTNNGLAMYKESRPNTRPMIKSDHNQDVRAMALRLANDFPEHCKEMTMRDAERVEDYFDPYDIQTQSWGFLFDVLLDIVTTNLYGSIEEVNEYAKGVKESRPWVYEQLTLEDTIEDVFPTKGLNSTSYGILASTLNKLKQWKFSEGMFCSPAMIDGYRLYNRQDHIS